MQVSTNEPIIINVKVQPVTIFEQQEFIQLLTQIAKRISREKKENVRKSN